MFVATVVEAAIRVGVATAADAPAVVLVAAVAAVAVAGTIVAVVAAVVVEISLDSS